MFSDWLSFQRRARPAAAPAPDADVQSLAAGVLHLCTLCGELAGLIADRPDAPAPQIAALSGRLEAARTGAYRLAWETAPQPGPDDPYSLAALSQWTWNE